MRFARLTTFVAFGLVASMAWALSTTVVTPLPGVNAVGALDDALGADVPVIVTVNTKNGKFSAIGRGRVQNLSKKPQTFTNPPLPPIDGATVRSVKYTVKKTPKNSMTAPCTLTVKGTIAP